jgi:NTE family protein
MKKLMLVTCLFCSSISLIAQLKTPPKNLVFEGAGIRGIAYAGAIAEMEAKQLMDGVEKVGGTSAGAITALVVALGYSGKEIETIVGSTNFKKFNDGSGMFVGGIHRTSKFFGWYRGRKFEDWVEKLIEDKTGNDDISFAQLHERGFKDLYVTGTCLNKQSLIVFSRFNYPNMKVKDAVRISMSIPLYFEAVFIDKEGNVVHKPKRPHQKEGLDVMVDGGLTGNFPIRMFDSTDFINPATIGFRIDSDEQVESDRNGRELVTMPVTKFSQYMAAFYTMILENLNRIPLRQEDWQRSVSIADGKISARIRKLSEQEIQTLIENGRQAVRNAYP